MAKSAPVPTANGGRPFRDQDGTWHALLVNGRWLHVGPVVQRALDGELFATITPLGRQLSSRARARLVREETTP